VSGVTALTAVGVGEAAQLACLLEVSAAKPGNVSPGRHFHDTRYEDFLASAVAIGPAMAGAASGSGALGATVLGRTVLAAVEATARWTRANTNLGIILLFAPLARAGGRRDQLRRVLRDSTVDDARDVYRAIRLARPGGLGAAAAQDVAGEPTVTLREAMVLAAARDGVAREYASDFATTFEVTAPALARARGDGLSWDDAIVETYVGLLALEADTHIVRKQGPAVAAAVTAQAARAMAAGGVRTESGRQALAEFDTVLRGYPHNGANPGTTADLTAAALFVSVMHGGWDAR
jgi:triphosphoribosyl-dephospho-CoA synthase